MLTGDLIRPRLRQRGSSLHIEMLDETSSHWLQTAAELIVLFRQHTGQPRQTWETALETYEGDRVDYIVLRGLAKVLADAATFNSIPTSIPPAELREKLFALGPAFVKPDLFHPQTRQDILRATAKEMRT